LASILSRVGEQMLHLRAKPHACEHREQYRVLGGSEGAHDLLRRTENLRTFAVRETLDALARSVVLTGHPGR
jgi:hypothetical protein